jgi:hypothetical protein
VTVVTAWPHRSRHGAPADACWIWNGIMLAYDYDYLTIVHLLGEAAAGWAIVGMFFIFLALT